MAMKKLLSILAFLAVLFTALPARAQFTGFQSPQSVTQEVFNAVTTPQAGPNWTAGALQCAPLSGGACGIQNLGQTIHFLTYTTTGTPTALDIRLEGSFDCSNYFPISEDSTASVSGMVYAIGSWPCVRPNLADFAGSATLTAFYTGTSATPTPPVGSYAAAQGLQKTIFTQQSYSSNVTAYVPTPTGSALGYILLTNASTLPSGSSISVTYLVGNSSYYAVVFPSSVVTAASGLILAVPAFPATQLRVVYTSGGTQTGTFDAYYLFLPAGSQQGIASGQPLTTMNSETVSAANSNVLKTYTGVPGERVAVYSVSARCSAGTSQLTIQDAGTTIWTSAATEVGTTTFKFQWNPGLASGVGDTLTINLATCGASNTGTLDVEVSQN